MSEEYRFLICNVIRSFLLIFLLILCDELSKLLKKFYHIVSMRSPSTYEVPHKDTLAKICIH